MLFQTSRSIVKRRKKCFPSLLIWSLTPLGKLSSSKTMSHKLTWQAIKMLQKVVLSLNNKRINHRWAGVFRRIWKSPCQLRWMTSIKSLSLDRWCNKRGKMPSSRARVSPKRLLQMVTMIHTITTPSLSLSSPNRAHSHNSQWVSLPCSRSICKQVGRMSCLSLETQTATSISAKFKAKSPALWPTLILEARASAISSSEVSDYKWVKKVSPTCNWKSCRRFLTCSIR